MYRDGIGGLEKNIGKALEWYTEAAKQQHSTSQHNIGIIYYQGVDRPKNVRTATYWFKQAAKNNLAESMSQLAIIYDRGQGTKIQPKLAALYLLHAYKFDDRKANEFTLDANTTLSISTRIAMQKTLKYIGVYGGELDGEIFSSEVWSALDRIRDDRIFLPELPD